MGLSPNWMMAGEPDGVRLPHLSGWKVEGQNRAGGSDDTGSAFGIL